MSERGRRPQIDRAADSLPPTSRVLRTWLLVALCSIAAFVPLFFAVVKENAGYFAISIAVALAGALVIPAPGEEINVRLTDPFGRFLASAVLCLSAIGAVLVWIAR